MADVYELFKDEIWKPDDVTNYVWYEWAGGEVFWNTENNIEDLKNGDGATYCGEVIVDVVKGDYTLYVLNDGCGNKYQAIFDLRNKKEF